MDLFNYSRRETSEVNIGATPMGGSNPIRIQSMTNTATQDTEASVAQAKRIVDAGGEYVRLTAQGIKEAENLMNINAGLRRDGYMVPLVADIHFNPKVADVAAQYTTWICPWNFGNIYPMFKADDTMSLVFNFDQNTTPVQPPPSGWSAGMFVISRT